MATRPAPPTKRGPALSEIARHVILPAGIESTGWPAVRDTCLRLNITFDPWQDGAGRAILGKRRDGLYAADAVVISIPRQVGKTFLIGSIMFALCIITPGTTAIWTAHRFKTARETFDAMRAMAMRPEMGPHVDKITTGAGDEAIHFRNGSRILFGARERGFGRGFSEVDILVLDEAQILTSNAMDDMIPATNQAKNPLILMMGTPPKPTDPGEVFSAMRAEAISGESDDTLYIECSADDDADPLDRKQWAKANASYPARTSARAILRMRKHLSPQSFLREGLGIWDKVDIAAAVIPPAVWSEQVATVPPESDVPPSAIGLDRWYDGATAVAGAWRDEDEYHVELVAVDVVTDTAGIVEWVAKRAGKKIPVVIAGDSPAAALIPDLKARNVKVITTSLPDLGKACGGFHGDVVEGRLTHADQAQLNDALTGAKKRKIGEAGAWGWDRKNPEHDISPLVAVTLARFGAAVHQSKKRTGEAVFR